MSLPELTHEEHDALVQEFADITGEMPTDFWLQAPDPRDLLSKTWTQGAPDTRGLIIKFLAVDVPHMYRNRNGGFRIVLPIDSVDYDLLYSIWPAQSEPMVFMIRENQYDTLKESDFFFRHGTEKNDGHRKLKLYELEDWTTH